MTELIARSPRQARLRDGRAAAVLVAVLAACSMLVRASADGGAQRAKPKAKPAAGQKAKPAAKLPVIVDKIPGTTVKLEFVKIPAGTIVVSDRTAPGGKRTVEIGAILIGKTEAFWEAYDAWTMSKAPAPSASQGADAIAKPSHSYIPPDRGYGHAGYPVISVSHLGASTFCQWLSKVTGNTYRLPTTAEWEYAARAGATGGAKSMTAAAIKPIAWVAENSESKTHPVGKKAPNAWGLYDILGNAGEWCVGLDGTPMLCGGSFQDKASKVTWDLKLPYDAAWQMGDPQFPKSKWWYSDGAHCGFRIVRVP